MKKFLIIAVVVAMMIALIAAPVMAAGKNGPSGKSNVGHVYLYEKDSDWLIVEDGAWGKYNYKLSGEGALTKVSGVFNGHGLDADVDYSLIYYHEPALNPWPAGGSPVTVIGSGMANEDGDVHITGPAVIGEPDEQPEIGDYIEQTGDKIWLVLSSDLTGSFMTGWTPSEYLFESALINAGA